MAVETRVGLLDELGSQAMATSSFRPPAHAAADLRNIKIADVVAVSAVLSLAIFQELCLLLFLPC